MKLAPKTAVVIRDGMEQEVPVRQVKKGDVFVVRPGEMPTMIATGVARPRAHGQLITSTEIPRANANPISRPARSQTRTVTSLPP